MTLQETIFSDAYMEAVYFTDFGPDSEFDEADLSRETDEHMRQEARSFFRKYSGSIMDYPEGLTQAGHDFWYTRNGHGAGFWENAGDPSADKLDRASRVYGPVDLYLGDDGEVHVA